MQIAAVVLYDLIDKNRGCKGYGSDLYLDIDFVYIQRKQRMRTRKRRTPTKTTCVCLLSALHTMAHIRNIFPGLRHIRIQLSSSEDDFEGFDMNEMSESRDWVENQTGKLKALARLNETEVSVTSVKNDFLGFENLEAIKHKFWTIDKVNEIRNIESDDSHPHPPPPPPQ